MPIIDYSMIWRDEFKQRKFAVVVYDRKFNAQETPFWQGIRNAFRAALIVQASME